MTTVDTPRLEAYRIELATVVERDPADLTDDARLVEDLGLDSLAMMNVLAWLDRHGVTVAGSRDQPATVGAVLALLDRPGAPGLSIRFTDIARGPARPTDVAVAAVAADPEGLTPILSTVDVRLTPVEPEDMRFLYKLATHPDTCFRWRYRGAPPPMEKFAVDLWSQVLVQFVARRTSDGEPIGLLVTYGADMGQRYAYVGAVFRPDYTGSGIAATVTAAFVRYLFHTFPMRKLYVEVPGFNWPQMRSGEGRLFEVEGIMRDHEFYAGRYWDRYLCAIYPRAVGLVNPS